MSALQVARPEYDIHINLAEVPFSSVIVFAGEDALPCVYLCLVHKNKKNAGQHSAHSAHSAHSVPSSCKRLSSAAKLLDALVSRLIGFEPEVGFEVSLSFSVLLAVTGMLLASLHRY